MIYSLVTSAFLYSESGPRKENANNRCHTIDTKQNLVLKDETQNTFFLYSYE
jgi:hypothetical protein